MRFSLVEYSNGIDLNDIFPSNISHFTARTIIEKANTKIRQHLDIQRNVFTVSDGKLRALGVAGTIRLTKEIELEVVPKLLSCNTDDAWKESLFILAALSKHGAIINNEHIRSSMAYRDSLYDIAGRILASEYCKNKRTFLRQYRKEKYNDYSVDGEINFDTFFERNPDGIPQERVLFDRINPYNATIQSAMRMVISHVHDTATRAILSRAISEFGNQAKVPLKKLKVPARNKDWTTIYELSYDIVSGMGTSFNSGEILSPGFMVNTWQIWEWIITISIKSGLKNTCRVIPQSKIEWGEKITSNRSQKINVFPDVSIYDFTDDIPLFLVDAKYKDLHVQNSVEISREDLYEAYAFCNATGAGKIYLAYPSFATNRDNVGKISQKVKYSIEDKEIIAISADFGFVSKSGDISAFCRNFATNLAALASQTQTD